MNALFLLIAVIIVAILAFRHAITISMTYQISETSLFKEDKKETPMVEHEAQGYIPDYILQRRIEKLTPEQAEQVLWSTKIDDIYFLAGYQYNDATKVKSKFKKGLNLQLIRDFENKADKNAIKVMFDNYHLGFIPSEHAIAIARKMDEEEIVFSAWVYNFDNSERKPFYKLKIHVYEN